MSNTEKTFIAGQRVYSLQGHTGHYVAPAQESRGHIVEALYIDEDDAEAEEPSYAGEVVVWPQVFAAPPKALLDEEVRLLTEHSHKLRVDICDLRAQQHKAEADMKTVRDSLKTHEALKYVDDILGGRITHYAVEDDHDAYVWSHVNAVAKKPKWFDDSSDGRVMSLRLHGWNSQIATWVIYGRDERRKVWPFTNEAEAIAKCQEIVQAKLNAMNRPDSYLNTWVLERLFVAAKACGVEVQPALLERKAREELNAAQAAVDKAQQELAVARARVDAAQAAFPEPTVAAPAVHGDGT